MQPGSLPKWCRASENAPVTIIEYASMTCPHCAHFHKTTYPDPEIAISTPARCGSSSASSRSTRWPQPASCWRAAADKDKYFPLIDTLFNQQQAWVVQQPLPPLLAIAKQAGFTQKAFEDCLANQKLLDQLEEVRQRAAEKFGVNSTPTFFINGKMVKGALTPEELDKQLEPYLKAG